MSSSPEPQECATQTVEARRRRAGWRILGALGVALSISLAVYLLLQAVRPSSGLISWTFLLLLPAGLSAFVAYVADPLGERRLGRYLLVPVWILISVVVVSLVFLKEGAICVVLLAPLWLSAGVAGAGLTWWLRRVISRGRRYCSAALLLPVVALIVEPLIPLEWAEHTVTRSIVVQASPATIWPLAEGITDVQVGEGRWNMSQDVIGIPRPRGARLVGEGVGADRHARWAQGITFRERITEWRPGHRLGWSFIFDDIAAWNITDPHLRPDSDYFQVIAGGYSLQPLGAGRTRVTLDTRYRIRTPLNPYSALWGEVILGDLENNLLAVVKRRAETSAPPLGASLAARGDS